MIQDIRRHKNQITVYMTLPTKTAKALTIPRIGIIVVS